MRDTVNIEFVLIAQSAYFITVFTCLYLLNNNLLALTVKKDLFNGPALFRSLYTYLICSLVRRYRALVLRRHYFKDHFPARMPTP